MYKGEKWDISKTDTAELQIRYYAGLAAARIPDNKAVITIYDEIRKGGYVENAMFQESEIYQELARAYSQLDDQTSFENIVKEGFTKFPGDEFFILSMINMSINSGKSEEAIDYINKAIEKNPNNAQLYAVIGQLFFEEKKIDEALKNLKKAVELEPDNAMYLGELGRSFFNLGVEKRRNADEVSDVARSKEIAREALDYYRQSMPCYEKVFELEPSNRDAIFALRNIYYSLEMYPIFEKMDALFVNVNEE
jgi:tetratricopeptide (TPR) repeat protein